MKIFNIEFWPWSAEVVAPENFIIGEFRKAYDGYRVYHAKAFVTAEEAQQWLELNVAKVDQPHYRIYQLTEFPCTTK